jgi:hypothetical protein
MLCYVILNVAVWRVRGVLPPLVVYYAHALVFLSPPHKKRKKEKKKKELMILHLRNQRIGGTMWTGICCIQAYFLFIQHKSRDKVCSPKVIIVT